MHRCGAVSAPTAGSARAPAPHREGRTHAEGGADHDVAGVVHAGVVAGEGDRGCHRQERRGPAGRLQRHAGGEGSGRGGVPGGKGGGDRLVGTGAVLPAPSSTGRSRRTAPLASVLTVADVSASEATPRTAPCLSRTPPRAHMSAAMPNHSSRDWRLHSAVAARDPHPARSLGHPLEHRPIHRAHHTSHPAPRQYAHQVPDRCSMS